VKLCQYLYIDKVNTNLIKTSRENDQQWRKSPEPRTSMLHSSQYYLKEQFKKWLKAHSCAA